MKGRGFNVSGVKDIFGTKDNKDNILNATKKKLFNELNELYAQMECTETWFQMEDDEDLIEASIYQRESLRARYRYLLKKAKANNISVMQR